MSLRTVKKKKMQFCRFAVFTAIRQNSLPLFAELPQKRQFGRTFAGPCRIADIMSLRTVCKKKMQFCRFAVFTAILQNSLPLFAELPQKRQFGRTFAGTCRIADIMSLRTVKKKMQFCRFAVFTAIR